MKTITMVNKTKIKLIKYVNNYHNKNTISEFYIQTNTIRLIKLIV